MQYLYHTEAGVSHLTLVGDDHRYIFRVRRHKEGERIALRNLQDTILYSYEIIGIDKRAVSLSLVDQRELTISARVDLHIGWCIIDPKSIEKMLPTLNEIGVSKITFIECQRSQRNFHIDIGRIKKILLNSSQQSGRSVMMQIEKIATLKEFVDRYPDSYMLNFSPHKLSVDHQIETIVVGCEGGFTNEEIEMIDSDRVVSFDTPLILRSESAVSAISSKILL